MEQPEHRVSFYSRRTYDSLGRILDLMRKMRFELTELHMTDTDGTAEITLAFRPLGHHSVDGLLCSIGQVVGVSLIRPDDVRLCELPGERQWSTCALVQG